MNNAVLADIANYAQQRLMIAYGYAGVATGDTMVQLNSSDDEGNDIVINIEVKPE